MDLGKLKYKLFYIFLYEFFGQFVPLCSILLQIVTLCSIPPLIRFFIFKK